jgi:hypothetical protein
MSKQAFAQASWMGPEGILASSFIYFMNPSNTLIGMEIYPRTMIAAIALAVILRIGEMRGWASPTDWNMLQRPWLRCKPNRMIAKMYQAETHQTWKPATTLW